MFTTHVSLSRCLRLRVCRFCLWCMVAWVYTRSRMARRFQLLRKGVRVPCCLCLIEGGCQQPPFCQQGLHGFAAAAAAVAGCRRTPAGQCLCACLAATHMLPFPAFFFCLWPTACQPVVCRGTHGELLQRAVSHGSTSQFHQQPTLLGCCLCLRWGIAVWRRGHTPGVCLHRAPCVQCLSCVSFRVCCGGVEAVPE